MKDMIRRHYRIETMENGATRCTGEVEREDHYSVEKNSENSVIFTLNGVSSKPVKIVHDSGWAWKATKTQIRTHKSIDELLHDLQDDFWSSVTYNMACTYCKE